MSHIFDNLEIVQHEDARCISFLLRPGWLRES